MPIMPPISLRCLGVRLLKLLSIAALLAVVLMWVDHRVSAQGGKDTPADAGDKGAADKAGDDQPGAKQAADAEPAEEPEEPPAAIADTGNYRKPTLDLTQKNEASTVGRIAQKGTFEGEEQAAFEKFFKRYFFPSWADPSVIPKVQEQRTKLRTFFKQSRSGQVHDHLLALSLQFLKILAGTNFHPAARYNAMLAIGELNDSEPLDHNPAVPCAAALPVLVESVKTGPLDALRVAALRGVWRHCTSGIADPQYRDAEVIPALLELAKSRPPKDRSPEGHAWMRTLAIDSLAALHAPGVAKAAAVGPNGVIDAMVKIVGDPASPPAVRCAAARALGNINPAPPLATTRGQMAALLRQLTADFCRAELERHKNSPDAPLFRREVRQRLGDVKVALEGQDEDHHGVHDAGLLEVVDSLIANLEVKDAKDDVLTKDIEDALHKLGGQAPAAATAAGAATPRAEAAAP
jgi:hypothetical protein